MSVCVRSERFTDLCFIVDMQAAMGSRRQKEACHVHYIIVGTASFVRLFVVVFLNPIACMSTMKHSSVKCLLHTRTLPVFGGSTSRSFLNQVSLSLWSFGNLKKLNPFLSASLLEQSYVIQYTIVSRIHPQNMSHAWEIKTLCATGFTDT